MNDEETIDGIIYFVPNTNFQLMSSLLTTTANKMLGIRIARRVQTASRRIYSTLQAEPFDASPIAGSSPMHRGHVIVHTQIPPTDWPSKVHGLSEEYDNLSVDKDLSDAGVLVGLAFDPAAAASDKKSCYVYPPMKETAGSASEVLSALNEERSTRAIHIYVCTHGNRDCRCADAGIPTVQSLRAEISERGLDDKVKVFEISHIGGHKWVILAHAYLR